MAQFSRRLTPRTDEWVQKFQRCMIGRGSVAELARHFANGDESKYAGFRTLISKVLDQGQKPSLEFALVADEWMQLCYGGVNGRGAQKCLQETNGRPD